MSHRSTSLLLAVYESVKTRATPPATGGSPVTWPYVVDALASLQPDAGWTDSTARKAYRNVRSLDLAERRNLIETVDEPYEVVVAGVMGEGVPRVTAVAAARTSATCAEVLDPHVLPENWVDAIYENAKEQARLRQQAIKPHSIFHLRLPETKPIMLVWTADWHLLDAGTDHDRFDEDVRIWTTTPGLYLGLGGDYANWFSPVVLPRAMPANTIPNDYVEPVLRKKMTEIHGGRRVLLACCGNHEDMAAATGWHPVDSIFRGLGIPNLGPGGRVFLKLGEVEYQIEARHAFNFNSALNDTNSHRQLWQQAGKPDMVFTAHLHHPTLHHRTFDGDDTVWARNGTYKREDHYAKSKNFVHTQSEPPDQPGVILCSSLKRMIPFRDYRDGLPLLEVLRNTP